jgi:hypothetical protein
LVADELRLLLAKYIAVFRIVFDEDDKEHGENEGAQEGTGSKNVAGNERPGEA